jgi:subtilisin family serine protease
MIIPILAWIKFFLIKKNMKSIMILLGAVIILSVDAYSQTNYYYYYKNEKQNFQINTQKAYLQLSEKISNDELSKLLGSEVNIIDLKTDNTPITYRLENKDKSSSLPSENYWAIIQFVNDLSEDEYLDYLNIIKEKSEVRLTAPYLINAKGNEAGLSQYIYVELKEGQSFSSLERGCRKYNLDIIGQDTYMKNWYIIACTPTTKFNGIEIAALLHELDMFNVVEPDLISSSVSYCTDDPKQWGLNAFGQTITRTFDNGSGDEITVTYNPTTDINTCEAWNITTGTPSVITAVLDNGTQNHSDLSPIMLSYDSDTDVSPGAVYNEHGTQCGGIIGGLHNGVGISGIAPNCNLISISSDLQYATLTTQANRSRGFNFAVENGASIITNSWGFENPSSLLDAAITNALVNGRNGLGMVVVFAAGNADGKVSYPANSNSRILSVGAMSPCEERSSFTSCDGELWGSNFGTELDIVAPGVFIPTTTNGNSFVSNFRGTSSAAPHVAGVAALVLSINPCLTEEEVRNIIENTAQKVGTYTYGNNPNRPNGTWHEEVGYGLIDAFQSVLHANTLFIQNQIDNGNEGHENVGSIRTGNDVDDFNDNADYIVNSSANVILKATEEIKLEAGTIIKAGSVFRAFIDEFNGECGEWLLPRIVPTNDDPVIAGNLVDKSNIQEAITQQIEVNISPNPFKNNFNLNIHLAKSDEFSLTVFNATGQLIYTQNGQLDKGKHQLNVPINQANGLYIVRLQVGSEIITKKLIKYE